MSTTNTQFGTVDESTYGTPVTVTRFWETNGVPGFSPDRGYSQSDSLRTGTRVARSDRYVPFGLGASGSVEIDVPTKSFGWWLKHMLGTVATGTIVDSNYTHTGTIGPLLGDSFTAQVGRVFHPSGTLQAFTYHGGKIKSWELSNDVEGLLVFSADCDFEDVETATALASASYPTSPAVFAWTGAAVTFGGSAVELTNFTVGVDNNLKTDRHYLRASALKKEPVEQGMRSVTWSADMDFAALTEYNRFVSATAAGAAAQIVATWTGPIIHAGATYPTLVVTIPVARFDSVAPSTSADPMTQAVSGVGLFDGTNSAVTVAYTSTDVTP